MKVKKVKVSLDVFLVLETIASITLEEQFLKLMQSNNISWTPYTQFLNLKLLLEKLMSIRQVKKTSLIV